MNEARKKSRTPTAARVAAYRQRQREAGLMPKTIWVPDTSDPKFIAEYRRQARALAADVDSEAEIMTWMETVADWPRGEDDIPDYVLPGKA